MLTEPTHGQARVSNELRKRGVFVSASGVRSIWIRHDLASFQRHLKALEAKVVEEGLILTESQVQRFHKTILQEFYQPTLRLKIRDSLEELQEDLDVWLSYYKRSRPNLDVPKDAVICTIPCVPSPKPR